MTKSRYFGYLKEIKESQHTEIETENDKILIIDGLNTFIRCFAVNPASNDDGTHIGGIVGFLKSIGYAIKLSNPTRCIITFDGKGGSQRRRKLFPQYKEKRKVNQRFNRTNDFASKDDERQSIMMQITRLIQYLDALPLTTMMIENIEADDTMAYLAKNVLKSSDVILMSTDKDFIQLVDDRIAVWSPTKKKLYFKDDVKEDYKLPAHNFLLYRTLTGDKSDNIPGIRGTGLTTLAKRLPILFSDEHVTIDKLLDECKDSKIKVMQTISENRNMLELNYKLMQLNEVDISGSSKMKIMNVIDSKISRMNGTQFKIMMIEDGISSVFKNLEFWLRERFLSLDTYANTFNNSCKQD